MSTTPPHEHAPDTFTRVRELRSVCHRLCKRLDRKHEKQREELAQARTHLTFQQWADTLLAHGSALARGTTTCELPNAHTGEPTTIRLNPKLDGRRNAELYYRKARKARRGLETIEANIAQTEEQLDSIGAMRATLERFLERRDSDRQEEIDQYLATATERLAALGALPRSRSAKREPQVETPYRHIRFADHDIFIGRNDSQNDELTVHFARPWDLWLHVALHAGSHVVIRRTRGAPQPPERVLAAAAAMAAWFSKARHSSSVEVHWTESRYVQKRRRSPAGEVYLQRHKTICVNPVSPQELFKRFPDAKTNQSGK